MDPSLQILVVEQNEARATQLVRCLEDLGLKVCERIWPLKGEVAMPMLADGQDTAPNLVITAVDLGGGIDGIEMARQLRSKSDIPIVFVGQSLDLGILARAREVYPSIIVPGPPDPDLLRAVVTSTWRHHGLDLERRRCEEILSGVLAAIPEGVMVTDHRDRVLLVNDVARRMLRLEAGSTVDEYLSAFIPGAPFADDQPGTRLVKAHRGDGSSFSCEVDSTFTWAAGSRLRVMVLRDISERERMQRRAQEMARLEALGHYASSAVHDLENLLSVVAGSLPQIEADARLGAVAREALEDIEAASRRGMALSRRLLRHCKNPAPGTTPAPIDLHLAVRETLPLLKRLLRPGIRLKLELGDPGQHRVAIEPVELDQLLLNLVMNAVEAMPEGGGITLRLRSTGQPAGRRSAASACVALEVEDSGIGIAPALQKRIFEPFFTTRGDGGSGLGLATVARIVERLGGEVKLRSAPGKGSCFSLYLPATDPEML